MSPFVRAALEYAQRGWPVFPLHGKVPIKNTRGLLDATTDEATITEWWDVHRGANVGIRCDDILVIDVDPRHGGLEEIVRLDKLYGLERTVTVHTGSGGWHLYYRGAEGCGSTAGKIGPGIDTRGGGTGYVVAPPSIHPETRGPYKWMQDRGLNEIDIAAPPDWLVEAIRRGGAAGTGVALPPEKFRDLWLGGAKDGGRNVACASLTGYFLRRYVDPLIVRDLVRMWSRERCDPPMDQKEVDTTVNSICKKELNRRGDDQ